MYINAGEPAKNILNKLNTEGLDGWELKGIHKCSKNHYAYFLQREAPSKSITDPSSVWPFPKTNVS